MALKRTELSSQHGFQLFSSEIWGPRGQKLSQFYSVVRQHEGVLGNFTELSMAESVFRSAVNGAPVETESID